MDAESKEKLWSYLSEENNVIALESDMKEIEYISCKEDLQLLKKVISSYEEVGYLTTNILEEIKSRLEEVPNILL
jgi:hypothetical protein